MADFEMAIHGAVKDVFGGKTKSRKCWFHMCKAVKDHLKKKVKISKGNCKLLYLLYDLSIAY